MFSIGVKNLRSLKDIKNVEIKPITVLLGKNSAGKSSFIRLFPLLKQTVEVKTSEPILWYGDYVDFGDYNASKSRNCDEKDTISFSFGIDISLAKYNRFRPFGIHYSNSFHKYDRIIDDTRKDFLITVEFSQKYVKSIKVEYENQSFELELSSFDSSKVMALNINGNSYATKGLTWIKSNKIIPYIINHDPDEIRFVYNSYGPFEKELEELIRKYCSSTVRDETINKIIHSFPLVGSKEEVLDMLQHNEKFTKTFNRHFLNCKITDKDFSLLNDYILGYNIPALLEILSDCLNVEFHNVFYSKPLRADIQRYYRVQGLGIDEIDSSGKNIPMFLFNMSPSKLKQFQEWTKKHFGIWYEVVDKEGHVSVMINDDLGSHFNLADVGVGYSQVLPIITNLWINSIEELYHKKKNIIEPQFDNYIVMEQPELHIHPSFQGKLVDAFAEVAKVYSNIHTKIIFETHSETMLNRLGYLVAKGKIDSALINVVLFEKDKDGNTIIKPTSFDNEGYLEEWPVDFFSTEKL